MSKVNLNYMYGVLCESDEGIDAFGNPIGKPILLEGTGSMLSRFEAEDIAKRQKEGGRFGDVKLVRLVVEEL